MPPLTEMIVPEIEEVVRTFSLVKVYERYEREHFGNGELILCGPGISIRFVRERDLIFMDLSGDAGDWVDANKVLAKLHVYPSVKPPVPITELVTLVCSNAEGIMKAI